MSREVMQKVLKTLKHAQENFEDSWIDAIAVIEAELAKPEPEPVAWMTVNEYGEEDDIHYENPEGHLLEGWTYKPLYTHPPTGQPEKEPLEYWSAVEGWVKIDEVREHFDSVGCGTIYKSAGEGRAPVYAAPPQRQPLTRKKIDEMAEEGSFLGNIYEITRAVEFEHDIKEKA